MNLEPLRCSIGAPSTPSWTHCGFERRLTQEKATTMRGVEAMDNSYRLLDLTVYGRQETWEDSPTGRSQRFKGKQVTRTDGRPTVQWSRLTAGYSDYLDTSPR
jgi:predicted dithiol-disulfide oxidoreductase (DUF899 family)